MERIVAYVERCQTPDGGFFFARVPPGGAMDTYHAVKTLQLLGRRPMHDAAVRDWIEDMAGTNLTSNPKPTFHLTGAGLALGIPLPVLRQWAARLYLWQNPEGGFGTWRKVDVEVSSELDTTFCAVSVLLDLDMDFDRKRVAQFVRWFQNADGGFGGKGRSILASTYCAVAVLTRLSPRDPTLDSVAEWLVRRERVWDVPFLEHLYWLVSSLRALGLPIQQRDRAVDFVWACRHPSGGFARAHVGIATLEYTHYALEVLKLLGAI